MEDARRFRLLGKYRTPRFRVGQRVRCLIRGEMLITSMTEAPLPWPIGKARQGCTSLVVYKDLAKAIHRESEIAVCHWWGVCPTTVWKRRKALGIHITTKRTSRLFREYSKEPWAVEALANGQSKASDPERRRKLSEAL